MVASTAREIAKKFLNLQTIFSDYVSFNGSQEAFEAMNLFLEYERWAQEIGNTHPAGSFHADGIHSVQMTAKLDIMRANFEQISQLLIKEHGFTSTAHNVYPIVAF